MKAYQLKIQIKDSRPPIWRRVIVPAGLRVSQLSIVLDKVMGGEDDRAMDSLTKKFQDVWNHIRQVIHRGYSRPNWVHSP